MLSKPNYFFRIRGVTILELMLALAISSIVLAAFLLFSKTYADTAEKLHKDIRLQLGIRSFVERLHFHAGQAGFSPTNTNLTPIKSANPIVLMPNSSPAVQVDVVSLQFVYDFDKNYREHAIYEVDTQVRKTRSEKRIILTRLSNNVPFLVDQVVLAGVKDFKCATRLVLETVRALDCSIVVYKDFFPNVETVNYDFTLTSAQIF